MCLILKHTSLAQYGMSHLAKGMVVPVIGSLVVAFSLLCMAKEFTCLLAFQCGDCFNCCCHSYIIFRISIIMLTVIAKGEQRLIHASCLIAWAECSALCPQLALCSLMHAQKKQRFCQDGVPSSRVLRVLLRHLPLQYVGSRPSTAD